MNQSSTLEQTDSTLSLQVQRVVKADRQRVYDAWTKPAELAKWFGPDFLTAPVVTNDLREGGAYRIEMKRLEAAPAPEKPGGDAAVSDSPVATGVYERIIPNALLSFTWRGSWEPAEETLVTVRFRDVEGGTEVTLTHERFLTERSRDGHEAGWQGSLRKLAALYES